MRSRSHISDRPLHGPRLALSVLSVLCLLAACATGVQGDDDDDDDDDAAGGGGAGSGTSTGVGGSGGTGGTGGIGGGGLGPARAPLAGEVIFIELMPNPDQLSDADAEWLELKNVSTAALDLTGCLLEDADPSGDSISITSTVRIDPGQLSIFAKSANAAQNGNLPSVAFAFGTDFSLANGDDEARLVCGGQVIDEVAYTSSWPYGTGASMQLRSDRQTAADNDNAANWCTATVPYTSGDLGSPGTDTNHCM